MNKRRAVLVVLVFLALTVCLTWLLGHREEATREVTGTIEADEARLASRYGGRVETIHADEGAALTSGQLVITLEARELVANRERVNAALAELKNGARPEEIAAARADWEALQSQLQFARTEAERARRLFEEKTISSTERDQALSRAQTLEKQVVAAEQRHELLLAGARKERIEQIQAELKAIDAQLDETKIAAPGAPTQNTSAESNPGSEPPFVLEVLPVKPGDVLAPNQTAAVLIRTSELWVRVYVPELWLGRISLNQRVKLSVDSHQDRTFEGVVEQINRKAEFTPRNVQTVAGRVKQVFGIKVRLPTDTGILKAGMGATVYFPDVPPIPKD